MRDICQNESKAATKENREKENIVSDCSWAKVKFQMDLKWKKKTNKRNENIVVYMHENDNDDDDLAANNILTQTIDRAVYGCDGPTDDIFTR